MISSNKTFDLWRPGKKSNKSTKKFDCTDEGICLINFAQKFAKVDAYTRKGKDDFKKKTQRPQQA